MSTQLALILAGVFIFIVAPLGFLLCCLDWRRIFGMRSMEEVRLRQHFDRAHEEVGQIFEATTAKMNRRSGGGDPFNLGNRNQRW